MRKFNIKLTTMTLNEVMTQTADAIREKTGKSELIAPVNFAEEIKSISAGGGESGGSSWRYFKFSNMTMTGVQSYTFKTMLAMVGKFDMDGAKIIGSTAGFIVEGGREFMANCVAGGIETSAKTNAEGELMDWNSYLEALGFNDSGLADIGITEITEAEFYDLNA